MASPTKSISVLIPNYDWDVSALINSLHKQLNAAAVPFEIVCFDDCSTSNHQQKNETVNKLENVRYVVNKYPLGRSKNRNELAYASCNNYLLFLDGDAGIEKNADFIVNYLASAKPDQVICGGTAYENNAPADARYLLRYLYGKKREEKPAKTRQLEPWNGFSAFNFLIPRHIFLELKFDENLSEYGHEDTIFGNELKYRCIPIKHIDNAALHLGLDTNEVFIGKTKKAVENLRNLIDVGLVDEDIKLYAWYAKTRKVFMTAPIGALYLKQHKRWEAQLAGPNPTLKLFDLYKLAYLCTLPVHHRKPPERKI
jgi:glycosyltransferase involved in cell wall biosynthesis